MQQLVLQSVRQSIVQLQMKQARKQPTTYKTKTKTTGEIFPLCTDEEPVSNASTEATSVLQQRLSRHPAAPYVKLAV